MQMLPSRLHMLVYAVICKDFMYYCCTLFAQLNTRRRIFTIWARGIVFISAISFGCDLVSPQRFTRVSDAFAGWTQEHRKHQYTHGPVVGRRFWIPRPNDMFEAMLLCQRYQENTLGGSISTNWQGANSPLYGCWLTGHSSNQSSTVLCVALDIVC